MAGKTISKLNIILTAQTGLLRRDFTKANKLASGFGRNLRSARGGASALSGIAGAASSAIPQLVALAGVALSVGAAIGKIRERLGAIDELAKTSDRLGISTEALSGLRLAAELTGAGVGSLDKGLEQFARRVSEASTGTGEAKDALEELGLSAQELKTKTPDEAFKLVAGRFTNVKTQADRVRLAYDLFGRAGTKLVNTLALGADGLAKSAEEAKELGIAVSRPDAAKIEAVNDAVTRMKAAWDGFANSFLILIAPALEGLAFGLQKVFQALTKTLRFFGLMDRAAQNASKSQEDLKKTMEDVAAEFVDQDKDAETLTKTIDALKSKGEQITKSVRTPAEQLRDTIAELNELFKAGAIDAETFGRAATKAMTEFKESTRIAKDFAKQLTPSVSAARRGTTSGLTQVRQSQQALRAATDNRKRELDELKKSNKLLQKIKMQLEENDQVVVNGIDL